MKKDVRLQIAITAEDRDKLHALAETNTGENKSLLVRKLIELAWKNPAKFDLRPPSPIAPPADVGRRQRS